MFGKLDEWVNVALGRISEHNNMAFMVAHFFLFSGIALFDD